MPCALVKVIHVIAHGRHPHAAHLGTLPSQPENKNRAVCTSQPLAKTVSNVEKGKHKYHHTSTYAYTESGKLPTSTQGQPQAPKCSAAQTCILRSFSVYRLATCRPKDLCDAEFLWPFGSCHNHNLVRGLPTCEESKGWIFAPSYGCASFDCSFGPLAQASMKVTTPVFS